MQVAADRRHETMVRTVTNRSYRDTTGTCRDAWTSGNTLSDFVTVYR
jgi:hypothetical protein